MSKFTSPFDDKDFLPFAKPKLSDAAIAEVVACLQSGWLSTGPRVKAFEAMLSEYLQAPHVVCLNSATAGLHLALLSLDLQPGDEVITTPLTFAATLNTIVHAHAKPVLVDVDRNTLNMDPNKIETAITQRTRAIMPVHFAGAPVDLEIVYQLAEKYNLRVIEDAAHAIGTRYYDELIGSFGDTQVFSFHPTKNITTIEGGAIVTRDEKLADYARSLSIHGMDKNAWNRYGKTGTPTYGIMAPGFKYNMTDVQAALGLHQLPELEEFIRVREQLVKSYLDIIGDWPELACPAIPDPAHRHAWHIFTPMLTPAANIDRATFIQEMKARNIGVGVHYEATHLSTYYRNHYGFKEGDFPIAEDIARSIVSLPLFPGMAPTDVDRVIEAMLEIFRR